MATDGYTFSIDHVEYIGTKDGKPFTLLDCWRHVYGVGHAAIYAPSGRVVLRNAGAISARWAHIDQARRRPSLVPVPGSRRPLTSV